MKNAAQADLQIVPGARVKVFQDPIDCTKLEGIAVVTKVIRVESWEDRAGNGIVRCNVRFPRTRSVYERDVSQLA